MNDTGLTLLYHPGLEVFTSYIYRLRWPTDL